MPRPLRPKRPRVPRQCAGPPYPALALWRRLPEATRKRLARADRTRLWRAACWEAAADEAGRRGSRARERACQVRAIGALLFGWATGDASRPFAHDLALDAVWQRRYLERLDALAREAEAVA